MCGPSPAGTEEVRAVPMDLGPCRSAICGWLCVLVGGGVSRRLFCAGRSDHRSACSGASLTFQIATASIWHDLRGRGSGIVEIFGSIIVAPGEILWAGTKSNLESQNRPRRGPFDTGSIAQPTLGQAPLVAGR